MAKRKRLVKKVKVNPKSIDIKLFIKEWDDRFEVKPIKGKKVNSNSILRRYGKL